MEFTKEQILETLGLTGVESLDKLKDKFNQTFVSRQIALEDEEIKTKIVGKITGGLSTLMKREFELDAKELDGKKVEDILTAGVLKLKSKITELETNATKGKDEAVIEWQTKADKYKKEAGDYKGQIDGLVKSLEDANGNFQKEKKSWSINKGYEDSYKKVFSQFADEVTKDTLKVEGYNTLVAKTFQFDVDDKNELVVFDREGKRIPSTAKMGTFLTPEEALMKIATENKLLKMNDGNKKTVIQQTTKTTQTEGAKKAHPNVSRFSKVI